MTLKILMLISFLSTHFLIASTFQREINLSYQSAERINMLQAAKKKGSDNIIIATSNYRDNIQRDAYIQLIEVDPNGIVVNQQPYTSYPGGLGQLGSREYQFGNPLGNPSTEYFKKINFQRDVSLINTGQLPSPFVNTGYIVMHANGSDGGGASDAPDSEVNIYRIDWTGAPVWNRSYKIKPSNLSILDGNDFIYSVDGSSYSLFNTFSQMGDLTTRDYGILLGEADDELPPSYQGPGNNIDFKLIKSAVGDQITGYKVRKVSPSNDIMIFGTRFNPNFNTQYGATELLVIRSQSSGTINATVHRFAATFEQMQGFKGVGAVLSAIQTPNNDIVLLVKGRDTSFSTPDNFAYLIRLDSNGGFKNSIKVQSTGQTTLSQIFFTDEYSGIFTSRLIALNNEEFLITAGTHSNDHPTSDHKAVALKVLFPVSGLGAQVLAHKYYSPDGKKSDFHSVVETNSGEYLFIGTSDDASQSRDLIYLVQTDANLNSVGGGNNSGCVEENTEIISAVSNPLLHTELYNLKIEDAGWRDTNPDFYDADVTNASAGLCLPVGVDESNLSEGEGMIISPNPINHFDNSFTVQNLGPEFKGKIQVINSVGQIVKEVETKGERIEITEISTWSAGMYSVRVINRKNESFTKKIIIY